MGSSNRHIFDSKSSSPWELRFGTFQVTLLVGVVVTCMMISFYFGYYTGQGMGVELALNTKVADAPKFPVAGFPVVADSYRVEDRDFNSRVSQQVMAQLGDRSTGVRFETATQDFTAPESKSQLKASISTEVLPKTLETNRNLPLLREEPIQAVPTEPIAKVTKDPVRDSWMDSLPEKNITAEIPAKMETKKVSVIEAVELKPRAPVSGWYIQVEAKTNVKDAQASIASLKKAGFASNIEEASVAGKTFYRVIAGPYGNKASAEKQLTHLKAKTANKDAFLRQIK